MTERFQKPSVQKPLTFDCEKIDLASARYTSVTSMPEIRAQIQAPQLEGAKRAQKY